MIIVIVFDVDISSLTQNGIQISNAFWNAKELNSSSMVNKLVMIEMLILLVGSFDDKLVVVLYTDDILLFVHSY